MKQVSKILLIFLSVGFFNHAFSADEAVTTWNQQLDYLANKHGRFARLFNNKRSTFEVGVADLKAKGNAVGDSLFTIFYNFLNGDAGNVASAAYFVAHVRDDLLKSSEYGRYPLGEDELEKFKSVLDNRSETGADVSYIAAAYKYLLRAQFVLTSYKVKQSLKGNKKLPNQAIPVDLMIKIQALEDEFADFEKKIDDLYGNVAYEWVTGSSYDRDVKDLTKSGVDVNISLAVRDWYADTQLAHDASRRDILKNKDLFLLLFIQIKLVIRCLKNKFKFYKGYFCRHMEILL